MLPSSLEDITIEHIEALAEEETDERKHLEFKRALDPQDAGHKKKFLKTVCAFANTAGGDLVIGIDDDPEDSDLYPETHYDRDDYKQRWENLLRSNTEPRIRSHEIEVFDTSDDEDDGFVTLVRVRPSNLSPHRATHSRTKNKFYARSNNDSYPMDIDEVREAFLEDYRLSERVEEFVADRIAKIRAGQVNNGYIAGPAIVMHVIPSSAFSRNSNFDISSSLHDMGTDIPLLKERSSGGQSRRNVDGVVKTYIPPNNDGEVEKVTGHCQVFKDGRIEAVHTRMVRFRDEDLGFWAAHDVFANTVPEVLDYLEERGASQPVYIFVSLLELKGKKIHYGRGHSSEELDRDFATLPSVTVESFTEDYEEVTKDVMRNMTHAFGQFGDIYEHISR